jgi:REP element-mobilizing transposase RayT
LPYRRCRCRGTPDTLVGHDRQFAEDEKQTVNEPKSDEIRRRRHHLPHWQQDGAFYWVTILSGRGAIPPTARQIVVDTLLHDHGRKYDLVAAVVMPDHVHLIMQPLCRVEGVWYDLAQLLRSIKGASAYRINRHMDTSGSVWRPESYDRIIRNEDEYWRYLGYLINNPVKRELVDEPEDYPYTVWPQDIVEERLNGMPDKSVGRTTTNG